METPTLVFFAIWATEDASPPFFSAVDVAEGVSFSLEFDVQCWLQLPRLGSLSHISDALTLQAPGFG